MNLKLIEDIKGIESEIREFRRHLHSIPELGMLEFKTSAYIKAFLDKEGISYKEYATTGICGIIKGTLNKEVTKVIGIRADMDALPLTDLKACEYKSKHNGKMHACGHDAHMAILMGVSKVLNDNRDLFSGTVKLIFEPAEETIGGSRLMIAEGVLENPKVDAMIGLHVEETLEIGTLKVKDGMVNAASNPFSINVHGVGGHGAYPSNAIDPILAASNMISSIQSIVSRELDPSNPAVITVGSIHAGTAPNIIPNDVEFTGIIRTLTPDDRAFATKRLEEVVKGVALTHRCTVDIDIEESYPCLTNNRGLVNLLRKSASEIIDDSNVLNQEKPQMGVESFSYFASAVPSVFYFLGCGNKSKGIVAPAHNSLFDIDEDCLSIGVAIQCNTAIKFLNN